MERAFFFHDGLRFSYLDTNAGAPKPLLLMLHAHWMGASDFEDVIPMLSSAVRIVALDQRGHGETDHGGAHTIAAYLGDIDALLTHLRVEEPIFLLGHSFGGMVANLYTEARPGRVRALIMEDIDVARQDHDTFIRDWAGTYSTREALEARIGPRLSPYLRRSMIQNPTGWRLIFDPEEVLLSEAALNGDHWPEWLSHDCPVLIIRGTRSPIVDGAVLAEMAHQRPNTALVEIDAGHSVHIDAPQEYAAVVRTFLASILHQ